MAMGGRENRNLPASGCQGRDSPRLIGGFHKLRVGSKGGAITPFVDGVGARKL